ncbi:MAG: hypothetical protein JRH15_03805 [Deltaproteobacteria bacterium]|nr:hypothetical protein [Deltaproteobacteria bacterium]
MVKKKGKAVSFDAMVKFFMQQYNIPTKKDIDKLMDRLDRLEKLIRAPSTGTKIRHSTALYPGKRDGKNTGAASDIVLELIAQSNDGLGVPDIKEKTGFGDKKLRNIIFRLYKTGRIIRKRRGLYVAA